MDVTEMGLASSSPWSAIVHGRNKNRCVAVSLMEIARGLMLILRACDDCRLGLEIADAGGHNGCDNVFEDLIDFCKDTGLQSSTAATRNSIIKLIGSFYNFVAPDVKGFMTYVNPALLSTLEAEYENNPFEGAAAAPKITVKAVDLASSATTGGLDGLPRKDIRAKITPTLIKNMGSSDWKVFGSSTTKSSTIQEEEEDKRSVSC
ncbi:hypothetical protein MKW98_029360 [Papaver atlanticum]|uniref:Uncharacterized protein n=1 Tax=Papaver atlanticum TaxID=357466 RepID=A0AAD4SJA0_9MAGN|nr:hypothetical protein MKW98_029360 [Papaver atlanticum]